MPWVITQSTVHNTNASVCAIRRTAKNGLSSESFFQLDGDKTGKTSDFFARSDPSTQWLLDVFLSYVILPAQSMACRPARLVDDSVNNRRKD